MNLLQKAKKIIVKSDGHLTKTGELLNYEEVHAAGIGLMAGYDNPNADALKQLNKWRNEHEDVDKQPHYFRQYFFKGQRLYLMVQLFFLLLILTLAYFFLTLI